MPRDENGRFAKHQPRAHPLAEKAFLFIELERASGDVEIDEDLSTPAETSFMLEFASEIVKERLYKRNVPDSDT